MATTDKLFAGSIPRNLRPPAGSSISIPVHDLAGRVAGGRPDCSGDRGGRGPDAGLGITAARGADRGYRPQSADARQGRPAATAGAGQWKQADALALPFQDEADAVACQFGAMFFPDKVQGYKGSRRVLEAGRPFRVQRVGQDFRERVRRRRHPGLAEVFPQDFALAMAHAARLQRRRAHPAGARGGELRRYRRAVDGVSKADSPRIPAIAICQGTPLRRRRATHAIEGATDRAAAAVASLRRRRRRPHQGDRDHRPPLIRQLASATPGSISFSRLEPLHRSLGMGADGRAAFCFTSATLQRPGDDRAEPDGTVGTAWPPRPARRHGAGRSPDLLRLLDQVGRRRGVVVRGAGLHAAGQDAGIVGAAQG